MQAESLGSTREGFFDRQRTRDRQTFVWPGIHMIVAMSTFGELLEAIAGSASTYTSSLQTSQVHPPGGGTLIQR